MRLQSFTYSKSLYEKNNLQSKKSLEKISSGSQVSKASQNPTGLAITETMKAQVRGLERGQRNMQDGLSLLSAADEGLNHVTKQLHRGYELAVMSSNATLADEDRKAAQMELNEILDTIEDTANYLEFNTINLFGSDKKIQIAGSHSGKTMEIELQKMNVDTLGLTNAKLDPVEEARKLFPKIQKATTLVTGQLTKIGSYYEALEHELSNSAVLEDNLKKGMSMIGDTNVSREMIQYTLTNIRQQADHILIGDTNDIAKGVLAIFK